MFISLFFLIILALIMGILAFILSDKGSKTTEDETITNSNVSYTTCSDSQLLAEFQRVFDKVPFESFDFISKCTLISEGCCNDKGTILHRFSCIRKKGVHTIEPLECSRLRKHLNQLIEVQRQDFLRNLSIVQATDSREAENMLRRNQRIYLGFIVENVCFTDNIVIFELYILDSEINRRRYFERGI